MASSFTFDFQIHLPFGSAGTNEDSDSFLLEESDEGNDDFEDRRSVEEGRTPAGSSIGTTGEPDETEVEVEMAEETGESWDFLSSSFACEFSIELPFGSAGTNEDSESFLLEADEGNDEVEDRGSVEEDKPPGSSIGTTEEPDEPEVEVHIEMEKETGESWDFWSSTFACEFPIKLPFGSAGTNEDSERSFLESDEGSDDVEDRGSFEEDKTAGSSIGTTGGPDEPESEIEDETEKKTGDGWDFWVDVYDNRRLSRKFRGKANKDQDLVKRYYRPRRGAHPSQVALTYPQFLSPPPPPSRMPQSKLENFVPAARKSSKTIIFSKQKSHF